MFAQRIKKVQEIIKEKGADLAVISNHTSIFYLTGFKGVSNEERESMLVVYGDGVQFLVPKMYWEQASSLPVNQDLQGFTMVELSSNKGLTSYLSDELDRINKKDYSICIEMGDLKVREFDSMREKLGHFPISWLDITEDIYKLRELKDELEVKSLKKAIQTSERCMMYMSRKLSEKGEDITSWTERDVYKILRDEMEKFDEVEFSFSPIVANGKNSSLPHHTTGLKKLTNNILLVDFGLKFSGYCADMTRTYWLSSLSADDKGLKNVFFDHYNLTLGIQKKIIEKVKPGVKASELSEMAINLFADKKPHFLHSLGHSVGLEIHEYPSLSSKDETPLEEGMVVTIEPGLYFSDWGGIRIEDMVLVTSTGSEVMTSLPKNPEEIIL